jgi:hypothetical protein
MLNRWTKDHENLIDQYGWKLTKWFSKDKRAKMAHPNFRWVEVEDTETENREWELNGLWYWQYCLWRWLESARVQQWLLIVLAADVLVFTAEGHIESYYLESVHDDAVAAGFNRTLSESDWDEFGDKRFLIVEHVLQWASFVLLSIFLLYEMLKIVAIGRYFLWDHWVSGMDFFFKCRPFLNVFDVGLVALPWYGYFSLVVMPDAQSFTGHWDSILVIARAARALHGTSKKAGAEGKIDEQKARAVRLVVQKKGFLTDAMSDYYEAFIKVDSISKSAKTSKAPRYDKGWDNKSGPKGYIPLRNAAGSRLYFLKKPPNRELRTKHWSDPDRKAPNQDRWRQLFRKEDDGRQVVYEDRSKGEWKRLQETQLVVDNEGRPSSITGATTISALELVRITKQLADDDSSARPYVNEFYEFWEYATNCLTKTAKFLGFGRDLDDGPIAPSKFDERRVKLEKKSGTKRVTEVVQKAVGVRMRKKKFRELQALTDARVTMATFGEDNNGTLDFREFVKMLVCRQNSSADQEIEEAYKLLVRARMETELWTDQRHKDDREAAPHKANPIKHPRNICIVTVEGLPADVHNQTHQSVERLFLHYGWPVRQPDGKSGSRWSDGMQEFQQEFQTAASQNKGNARSWKEPWKEVKVSEPTDPKEVPTGCCRRNVTPKAGTVSWRRKFTHPPLFKATNQEGDDDQFKTVEAMFGAKGWDLKNNAFVKRFWAAAESGNSLEGMRITMTQQPPLTITVTKTSAVPSSEDYHFDLDALTREGTHGRTELEILRHNVYNLIETSGCQIIKKLEKDGEKRKAEKMRTYEDVRKCLKDWQGKIGQDGGEVNEDDTGQSLPRVALPLGTPLDANGDVAYDHIYNEARFGFGDALA